MPADARRAHAGRASSSPTRRRCWSSFPDLAGTPYPRAGAYAAVPLVAYGRTPACSRSASRAASRSTPTSAALLNALAAQAAIALARAQLYEREHTVSQTLQASLLPRALPDVPGLDLAGRLEAAHGVEVGGDFYDAFALGDGAWGIAIGDVCGKGVDAAALTALARHTMRAAAHAHDARPRPCSRRSTARCSTRAARASS